MSASSTTRNPPASTSTSSDGFQFVQVPLSTAHITNITSSTSTVLPEYSDPSNFVQNKTWLLPDNSQGTVQFVFEQQFHPELLELKNTQQDGRGTKSWRFNLGIGNAGIANFTYIDPVTGQTSSCDAACPLSATNSSWQTFVFVNYIPLNAFQLEITNWYGAGGGFDGFVLYTDGVRVNTSSSAASSSAVSSTVASSSATATTAPTGAPTTAVSNGGGLSGGSKAGIAVGMTVGTLLIASLLLVWFRKRKLHKTAAPTQEPYSKPELEAKSTALAEVSTHEHERHELPVQERPTELE